MRIRYALTSASLTTLLMAGAQNGLAEEKPAEPPKWVSSAAAGLTLTTGNSESLMATAKIDSAKKWGKHEISLGADAAYGETTTTIDDGNPATNDEHKDRTAASAHAFGQYNRLFTERFYGYGRADILHDAVADVTYRLTLSPGVGYYFIKNPKTEFSVEVGPGYIYEETGSGTNRNTDGYVTLRVADKFKYKFSDHARLWQSAEILPQVDDFENFIVNAELGVEADLTKNMSLRSYVQDTFDNQPAPGRDENDLKWITAIAYKF